MFNALRTSDITQANQYISTLISKLFKRHKRYEFDFERNKSKHTESLAFWMALTTIIVIIITFVLNSINSIDPFMSVIKTHDSNPIVISEILVLIASNNDVSCFGAIDTSIKYAYNPERLSFIIVNLNNTNNQSCLQANVVIGLLYYM